MEKCLIPKIENFWQELINSKKIKENYIIMSMAYLKNVFKTIEKFRLVEKGDVVFVALSGGKDSASALFALKEFEKTKSMGFELKAFHINLGGNGSEKIQEVVKEQAKLANVQLFVHDLKESGISLEEISKSTRRPVCSVCGVVKRYLLNKIPRELGATKIATGHQADDFAVFFFKNLLGQNFSWIGKFRPKLESKNKKLLTKIRPLFFVSGRDNKVFCKSLNIPFLDETVCPYFSNKMKDYEKAKKWYGVIHKIESEVPGFKERLINSIEKISEYFYKDEELMSCKVCGEPTSGEVCAFCRLTKKNIR